MLHEIKVVRPDTLSTSRIVRSLADAAFEIDSVLPSNEELDDAPRSNPPKTDLQKLHIQKCDECALRQEAPPSGVSGSTEVEALPKKDSSETTISASSSDVDFTSINTDYRTGSLTRITLAINGMSCSSCVSKIAGAIQEKPWVRSADVNLLTSSASVVLLDGARVDEALRTVRDAGYNAELVDSEEIQPSKPSKHPVASADMWRASYAIGGMSCSSCVGNVTDALNHHDWITKVDVNLVSSIATVEFQGKGHLEQIVNIIQSLGYSATLSDIDNMAPSDDDGESPRQSVTIQIDGMHCAHCPKRVLEALATYSDRVEVTDPPTETTSKLTVSYIPEAPHFTIRHILRTIADVDKAFMVSIYHPPTLEERSHAMHRRQQWQIASRLILAVLSAIPTFIIGIVYMSLVSKDNSGRKYLEEPMWSGQATRSEWALLFTSTPVYFFAADIFHRRMITELKALWRPGSQTPILRRFYRFGSMDMLMSLGTSIAYFSSIAFLAINASRPVDDGRSTQNKSFFDAVVFLTMFLMIGRLLEAYSKAKAGDAVSLLSKLRPTEAVLVDRDTKNGNFMVPIDQLEIGDVVRVTNGASPPYDGIVVEGESRFDESSLTGESKPVSKKAGDDIFSGTINQANPITMKITRRSGDSMLDQIIDAVRQGQIRRAPIERVADAITGIFVPVITLIAILDWIIWLSLGVSGRLPEDWMDNNVGGWPFWSLQFAISVFVVACPCGIGLAAPTALFVGGGLAAKHGILVKGGGEAFQEASHLDCIVFDKTGTITEGGEPAVTDHQTPYGGEIDKVWGALLELEQNSSHPIARAMVSFAASMTPPVLRASAVDEIPGKGMKGSFPATASTESLQLDVIVGNEALMHDHDVAISSANAATLDTWKREAKSVVLVAARTRPDSTTTGTAPWELALMLAVADRIRPEASDILQALRDRKIAVWMISGDNPTTAHAVGKTVGIPPENIIAGVLPEQKADKIQYLQKTLHGTGTTSKRALIAMVGDGINDSPALTVADVGIAIGSGSDIAISSAEFVLVTSGLGSLLTLIDLSRAVFRRIKFNFGWALVYNCVAVPVAAGVFYPIVSNGSHVRLDPVWSSLAMALSSVSVVCSSLLMRTRIPLVGFRAKKMSV